MGVMIEITAGSTSSEEWQALAAFIAVMSGGKPPVAAAVRGPAGTNGLVGVDIVLPPASDTDEENDPPEQAPLPSEALLAAEAARAAGAEIDVNNLPWDARIHASTKVKNNDGSWRNKRGVDAATAEAVTVELKSVMAAPLAPPPPVVDDPAAAFGTGEAAPPAPLPPEPAVEEAPPAPAPAPETGLVEFARVMRVVTAKQAAKTVTTEFVTGLARQLGLTGVADLAKRPDLIPAFEALLP